MKRCSVKPYEGEEKYIFVSYCHKDKASVFPIIEQLAKDGYRIWYDEGIDPGSEWPETIASHLDKCEVCIAFITENSMNSHNCRREINFALLKKKNFISIILEELQMPLGMEMQLSATQSIFKFKLPSENEFYNKLRKTKTLIECQGTPDESIIVSKTSDYDEYEKDMFSESELRRDTFSDKWFIGDAPNKQKDVKKEDEKVKNNASQIEEIKPITQQPVNDEETKDLENHPVRKEEPQSIVQQPAKVEESKSSIQHPVHVKNSKENNKPIKPAYSKKKVIIPLVAVAIVAIIVIVIVSIGKSDDVGLKNGNEIIENDRTTHSIEETEVDETTPDEKETQKENYLVIAGENVSLNENSIRIENKQITEEDIKNISQLAELTYLTFEGCQIDSGALKYLNGKNDSLSSLTITNCGLTDEMVSEISFSSFPELAYLYFTYNQELTDISKLSELSDIRCIRIDMTGVKDISVLSKFEKLESVHANGNGIEDISALDNKKYLSELCMNNNKITDISVLYNCPGLFRLELANNQIESLDALMNCKKLNTLIVNGNKLSSLSGLENAIALKDIDASNNNIITIDGLANCTILEEVQLNNNKIKDISLLAKSADKLFTLSADNNEINDISALKGTDKLRYLYLSNNNISDINALATSTELWNLALNNNKITKVDALENLVNLNLILLSGNQIEDVSPIAAMISKAENDFQNIDLSRNKIGKVNFSFVSDIQFLFLYENPINDITVKMNTSQEINSIEISYNEKIDFENIFNVTTFVTVVDCPLDKQMAVMEYGRADFITAEEADKLYEGVFDMFEDCEVRNLVGDEYLEALILLGNSGYGFEIICIEEYSEEYEAGIVMKQSIESGSHVRRYEKILLTVSKGKSEAGVEELIVTHDNM